MNLPTVKLKNIFIGEVDGETEAQREKFDELFYVEEDICADLLEDTKFVVVGRKGTGKTILGNYLKKRINLEQENSYCYIKGANDLNLYQLIEMGEMNQARNEGELVWEYVLYGIIAEIILENSGLERYMLGTPTRKLYKFSKSSRNKLKLAEVNISESIGGQSKTSIVKSEIGNNFNQTTTTKYVNKKYYDKLAKLKELVMKAISRKNITLIIDDLDCLNVSAKMDINYSKCIANLINIAKKINIDLSKSQTSKSKIIILLRDDIIRYLNDNDSNINKSISNRCVYLNWFTKPEGDSGSYKHPLIKMVLLKIRNSTPQYKALEDEELYQMIFPDKIGKKNVVNYLLDYSFGRPRDIIQFLNIVKDKDKESKTFKKSTFKKCVKEYSESFYRELKNEISIHENATMLNDSIKLIKNLKRINFDYTMIEEYYNANKVNYPNIADLNECLDTMYMMGIIGNSWKVTMRNGQTKYHVSWSYREEVDVSLDYSKTFTVHGALWKSLSLQNCG